VVSELELHHMVLENSVPSQHNPLKVSDAEMASAHLQKRRELRYKVSIPIEISGFDRAGNVFHERTVTKNVSEWGCGFLTSAELRVDDIIALQAVSAAPHEAMQTPRLMFQVVRVQPEEGRWFVGAWKMDVGSAWGVDLHELSDPEEASLQSRGTGADVKTPAKADRK